MRLLLRVVVVHQPPPSSRGRRIYLLALWFQCLGRVFRARVVAEQQVVIQSSHRTSLFSRLYSHPGTKQPPAKMRGLMGRAACCGCVVVAATAAASSAAASASASMPTRSVKVGVRAVYTGTVVSEVVV